MPRRLQAFFDTQPAEVYDEPFPHVVVDGFFRPEVFAELCASYPKIDLDVPDRSWAKSLYPGDSEYERLLESSRVWRELVDALKSDEYIHYISDQFAQVWQRAGCRVDFAHAKPVEFFESRAEKERMNMREASHGRDDLFCRLDLYQAWPGYRRPIHLDHRRRLASQLIYFDDAEEISMEGGELLLHESHIDLRVIERLGMYQTPINFSTARSHLFPAKKIAPAPNRMVMFPCTRASWHSVPEIRALGSPRQYVQIQLSSSVDVWS